MSTVQAPVLPLWAREALGGIYAGEALYVQGREERAITFRNAARQQIAWITWGGWNPTIGAVSVREGYRRLGLATELLRRAREIEPDLRHSDALSFDAQAWIAALGELDRCKTPR